MNPLKALLGAAIGLVGAAVYAGLQLYTGRDRLLDIDEQLENLGIVDVLEYVLSPADLN